MNKLVLFLLVMFSIFGCKKSSSEPAPPPVPMGNYIKIDNDSRQLGDVPTTDILYSENTTSDGPLLILTTSSQSIKNIDDSKNENLTMNINIFEGDTLTNEYLIHNVGNPPPSSAWVNIFLSGVEVNGSMTGQSGKLYIERDATNKIKSFRFENVQMKGTYQATVSCKVVVK